MSDVHGLITHQPGYYYITLEEDYVVLFEQHAHQVFETSEKTAEDEQKREVRLAHAVAKAYISSVLEQLSESVYKTTGAEEEIWVFLSFPELEQRLHKAYKMRALKEAMKELTDDGYVRKRPNRDPRFKALEYQMDLARYREGLNALPRKASKKSRGVESVGQVDSAKMHDDSAKMHDDSAKMHDDSAKMHPRINIDRTKNNSEQQRETPTSFAHGATEMRMLANANDALPLISSLFHLPLEEARKVIDVVQRLQKATTQVPGSDAAPHHQAAGKGDLKESKEQKEQGKGSTRRPTTAANVPLTLQGQHILDLYDGFKRRKASRNSSTLLAANGLGEVVGSDDDFLEVLKAIAGDEFLTRKKVRWDLDFVYRKYDGFLDQVERTRRNELPGTSGEHTNYNEVAGMTDEQREAYKRQQQAKHTIPGVNRETLMQMKPEERIAYLKHLREQQAIAV